MSTIVTRAGKGSPLTNAEMDANLNNLNNDKIESTASVSVDSEIALFSSTTGKVIKRASTTGLLKATSGVLSAAAAGTDYVAPTGSDGQLTRQMLIDCGYTAFDKGNSGTSTQTYDYTQGSLQTSTATGNHTITFSNWPPTGNLGVLQVLLTNGGAFTITWPTINWIKPDGTTTTSISTYLAALTGRTALQSSGVDQFVFWTRDAGTTVYGKLI